MKRPSGDTAFCIGGVLDGKRIPYDGMTRHALRPVKMGTAIPVSLGPVQAPERDIYLPYQITTEDGAERRVFFFYVLDGLGYGDIQARLVADAERVVVFRGLLQRVLDEMMTTSWIGSWPHDLRREIFKALAP